MRILPNSILIRYNQTLAKELATKYIDQINKTPLEYDSRDKLANLIGQCGEEYLKSVKGIQNFYELKELLKHLYKIIVVKVHNNIQ